MLPFSYRNRAKTVVSSFQKDWYQYLIYMISLSLPLSNLYLYLYLYVKIKEKNNILFTCNPCAFWHREAGWAGVSISSDSYPPSAWNLKEAEKSPLEITPLSLSVSIFPPADLLRNRNLSPSKIIMTTKISQKHSYHFGFFCWRVT